MIIITKQREPDTQINTSQGIRSTHATYVYVALGALSRAIKLSASRLSHVRLGPQDQSGPDFRSGLARPFITRWRVVSLSGRSEGHTCRSVSRFAQLRGPSLHKDKERNKQNYKPMQWKPSGHSNPAWLSAPILALPLLLSIWKDHQSMALEKFKIRSNGSGERQILRKEILSRDLGCYIPVLRSWPHSRSTPLVLCSLIYTHSIAWWMEPSSRPSRVNESRNKSN